MKFIRAAKVFIVVNGDVLLLRNSSTHPRWPNYNDLPGGTAEDDELIEQAVVREVQEETTAELNVQGLKLVHADTLLKPDLYIIYQLYRADLPEKPQITLSYEHDNYDWVKLQDISNLEPHYQESYDFLKQNNLL